MFNSISRWGAFVASLTVFMAHVGRCEGQITRKMRVENGIEVTYPEELRAEARFLLDFLIEDRRDAASSVRSLASENRERFLRGAATRLGLKRVSPLMRNVWDSQVATEGAALGEFRHYNLVAVDLWRAAEFFKNLAAHSGLSESLTKLRQNVSPHFQIIVDVKKRTISYFRTGETDAPISEVEEIRIPLLLRDGDALDESKQLMRDTLVGSGLVAGGTRYEARVLLVTLHEVAENAFVRMITSTENRRWISEGVATWVAIAEMQKVGLVGDAQDALDLLWPQDSCLGFEIGSPELYTWPVAREHHTVTVPGQNCYYRTSAWVFVRLAEEYGDDFVRKWFRRVQREPYEKRTIAVFEREFKRLTKRELTIVIDELLASG